MATELLNKEDFPLETEYVEQCKQGLCTVTEMCINLLECGWQVQTWCGNEVALVRDNPDGTIGEMGFPNMQRIVM